jgi:hypothetical protein
MSPRTAVANTATWLAASKELKLSAFAEDRVLSGTISVRSMEAILSPRQSIAQELVGWDLLSDEALVSFEQAIG